MTTGVRVSGRTRSRRPARAPRSSGRRSRPSTAGSTHAPYPVEISAALAALRDALTARLRGSAAVCGLSP